MILKDMIKPIEKEQEGPGMLDNLKTIQYEDLDTRYSETHFRAHFKINPNHHAIRIKKDGKTLGVIKRDPFDVSEIVKEEKQRSLLSQSVNEVSELPIVPSTPFHIPTFQCQVDWCVCHINKNIYKEPFYDRKSKPPVCDMCLQPMKRIK